MRRHDNVAAGCPDGSVFGIRFRGITYIVNRNRTADTAAGSRGDITGQRKNIGAVVRRYLGVADFHIFCLPEIGVANIRCNCIVNLIDRNRTGNRYAGFAERTGRTFGSRDNIAGSPGIDLQLVKTADPRIVNKRRRTRTAQIVNADRTGNADFGAALFDQSHPAADRQNISVVIGGKREIRLGARTVCPRFDRGIVDISIGNAFKRIVGGGAGNAETEFLLAVVFAFALGNQSPRCRNGIQGRPVLRIDNHIGIARQPAGRQNSRRRIRLQPSDHGLRVLSNVVQCARHSHPDRRSANQAAGDVDKTVSAFRIDANTAFFVSGINHHIRLTADLRQHGRIRFQPIESSLKTKTVRFFITAGRCQRQIAVRGAGVNIQIAGIKLNIVTDNRINLTVIPGLQI